MLHNEFTQVKQTKPLGYYTQLRVFFQEKKLLLSYTSLQQDYAKKPTRQLSDHSYHFVQCMKWVWESSIQPYSIYTPYVTVISKFYGWYVEKANLHLDEFSLLILKTYLHSKRPCPIEKFTFRYFITLSQNRGDILARNIWVCV